MLWVIKFWATISKTSTLENKGFLYFFVDSPVALIFLSSISHERQFQSPLTIPLSERTQQDLSGALNYFVQILSNFLLSPAEKNWTIFDIVMTITLLGVNMITRQITPFFSYTLWPLSVGKFHFCVKFHGVPLLHYVLVCKIHIYTPKMALSSLLT